MRNVNKVILVGNLTRDPQLKQTQSGQAIATFGIATNRDWVTRDGNRHTSTEFHECVAWAKLADLAAKFLEKGKLVYVEGYLKTRSWTTDDGQKHFRTEAVVQDLIMLSSRPRDEEEAELTSSEASEAIPEEAFVESSPETYMPESISNPAA